jgi:hypothetical protein
VFVGEESERERHTEVGVDGRILKHLVTLNTLKTEKGKGDRGTMNAYPPFAKDVIASEY